MPKWLEDWYPYLGGLAGPVLVLWIWRSDLAVSQGQVSEVLGGTLALGGVMVGFLAAAQAILFALPDRPIVTYMKTRGGFTIIARYLHHAILLWLVTTVADIGFLFFLPVIGGAVVVVLSFVWCYLVFVSLLAFHRCISLFGKLLHEAASSKPA